MRDALDLIGDLAMALSLLVAGEWLTAYHRYTCGDWRRSAMGRHLMAFMAVLAGMFAVITTHWALVQLPSGEPARADTWFLVVRAGVFTAVPVVLFWRRLLLRQAHRERGT